MTNYHFNPRRNHYRKPGKDYAQPGNYFITINTYNWLKLFGEKSGNEIILNRAGKMIHEIWQALPARFPHVKLDEYIVMPNHFHAIVIINEANQEYLDKIDPRDRSIAKIIGAFKSITTVEYIKGVEEHGWPRFNKKLWHFRFYDRIIPDNKSLEKTRQYIIDNPSKWNP